MGWVLDHRRDVETDFRHLFHLSPAQSLALPGPEYLALVYRMPALNGVMAARAAALQERQQAPAGGQEVPATPVNLQTHPTLAGWVDYG